MTNFATVLSKKMTGKILTILREKYPYKTEEQIFEIIGQIRPKIEDIAKEIERLILQQAEKEN